MPIQAVTLADVVSNPVAVALVVVFLTSAIKQETWKPILVNLLSLGLGVALALGAVFALSTSMPTWAAVGDAVLNGIVGAALATYGYEGYKNIKGFIEGTHE